MVEARKDSRCRRPPVGYSSVTRATAAAAIVLVWVIETSMLATRSCRQRSSARPWKESVGFPRGSRPTSTSTNARPRDPLPQRGPILRSIGLFPARGFEGVGGALAPLLHRQLEHPDDRRILAEDR